MLSTLPLLGLAAIVTGAPAGISRAANHYAGVFNLTELTIKFQNGTSSTPLGAHPYGRLILTHNGYFISQFNSGDYAAHPFQDFPALYVPGTPKENAEVVRNSLGLSGTYQVNTAGEYLGLSTSGSTIPNYIDSTVRPPNSTFTLEENNHILIETLANPVDNSRVEYRWERLG